METEKREVTICFKCEKVKRWQGGFEKKDKRAIETIKMSKDLFVVVEALCDDCSAISVES